MQIQWTEGARAQFIEAMAYIAQDNPEAARRLRGKIKQAVTELREHPQIGRMVPEFEDPSIRERIVAPYRIIYMLDGMFDGNVRVLGVYHSRRLLPDVSEQ